MSESGSPSKLRGILGCLLLLVGVSVFAIRLQHAGPYALPRGGNLLGGVLSLLLGGLLTWAWLGARRLPTVIGWALLAASPVVLFFALYATLAELEEVVVLKATDAAGQPSDLRLWIVDRPDGAWVTMMREKADANGLRDTRAQLLREGELRCVVAVRDESPAKVDEIHRARHEKYAVQRLATVIGLFDRTPGAGTVALRLAPCPDA